MAQAYEYNSEKNAFKVMYNFEVHDSLPPCSELNKNLKQIDYLMLVVQFARGKSGLSTHNIFALLLRTCNSCGDTDVNGHLTVKVYYE